MNSLDQMNFIRIDWIFGRMNEILWFNRHFQYFQYANWNKLKDIQCFIENIQKLKTQSHRGNNGYLMER